MNNNQIDSELCIDRNRLEWLSLRMAVWVELYWEIELQGYRLTWDEVDEEAHDLIVSVFLLGVNGLPVGHPIIVSRPLAEIYWQAWDKVGYLHFMRGAEDGSLEEPAGDGIHLLYKEYQVNGKPVYIYFDETAEGFPVILRMGNQEIAFCTLSGCLHHYRECMGFRDVDSDYVREDLMRVRKKYTELMRECQSRQKERKGAEDI